MKGFDLEGHRGSRGLAPENTYPAFIEGIKNGVSTLEMDVVITKDKQVLVSHDLWMNKVFCLNKNGEPFAKQQRFKYRIYNMTYQEVKKYDCGSLFRPDFPNQKLQLVHKPLLREVIAQVESYINEHQLTPIHYNIEIKSMRFTKGIFHPRYDIFTDLVVTDLRSLGIINRVTLQCFDTRVLNYLNDVYPEFRISFLVENLKNFQKNMEKLNFIPQVYSPDHRLVHHSLIHQAHAKDMHVIPWTVNTAHEMNRLIDLGVDGFITDYPNIARALLDSK